ncbi:MAG TPA: hypothetical protein VFS47_10380 [Steroidobacteraceae bacterium]|nr:hypothetical protein [Steroidobacteraceae bacterium]
MNSATESAPAARVSAAAYSVTFDDSDPEQVCALWRDGGLAGAGDLARDRARYEWFYQRNPQGLADLNLLTVDAQPEPVGFLGIGARRFILNEREVEAGVLVDFVVKPSHRSVLPALTLQRRARERALKTKSVVYGLPDVKAVALCKRLQVTVEHEMQRWVRVIRSRAYLHRKVPAGIAAPLAWFTDALDAATISLRLTLRNVSGEWGDRIDSRIDSIWGRVAKAGRAFGVRNQEFLAWRFEEQPGRTYRTFLVSRKHDLVPLVYFVCERTESFLVIRDFLNAGTDRDLRSGLLLLSRAARRLGVSAISLEVVATESTQRALRRSQFVRRSHRPFFAVLTDELSSEAKRCAWFITPADEDV